jgi:hypothetical protein
MNATNPAARAAVAFKEFFARSAYPPFPGFSLLGALNPADKLITREGSNVFP